MSRVLRLVLPVVVLLVPAAPAGATGFSPFPPRTEYRALLKAPARASAAAARPRGPFPVVDSIAPRHLRVGQVLTIRGHGFLPGNGRDTVVFTRNPARSPLVFVRAGRSSSTRIRVRIPERIGTSLGQRYIRFRMRVLARRFAQGWTSPSRSPYIRAALASGTNGAGECGTGNADQDGDGLTVTQEQKIRTDPCRADTDGDGSPTATSTPAR